MKITDVKIERFSQKLVEPFFVAFGEISDTENWIVKISTDEGVYGLGSCAPMAFVTGETFETCHLVLKMFAAALIGRDALDIAGAHVLMDGLEELADPTRFYIGGFDMAMMAIGLNNSFTSYSVLFDDASGLNMACFTGAERDAVLEKVLSAVDEASVQDAMKAVVDSLAYIPLTYVASDFAYDANLNHGLFYTTLGAFLFSEFSWKA